GRGDRAGGGGGGGRATASRHGVPGGARATGGPRSNGGAGGRRPGDWLYHARRRGGHPPAWPGGADRSGGGRGPGDVRPARARGRRRRVPAHPGALPRGGHLVLSLRPEDRRGSPAATRPRVVRRSRAAAGIACFIRRSTMTSRRIRVEGGDPGLFVLGMMVGAGLMYYLD